MKNEKSITDLVIPAITIEDKIYIIRGEKVMLDFDLAFLYEVETKALNQAVRRNADRFPPDFMFELNNKEIDALLKSQKITLSPGRGSNVKYAPLAFTEQGVAMLSSVLRSPRAVQINIQIMRAFTKMKKLLSSHIEIREKLEELEQKCDSSFRIVFQAIDEILDGKEKTEADESQKQFGFDPAET